ncbi:amidase signature domain-containing protein [Xylariales sp. PMI_506]|nr:amidase signature domain-containing protein [Xylariales sp. PMI_506]
MSQSEDSVVTSVTSPPIWEVRAAGKRNACLEKMPTQWMLPESTWDSLPTPLAKHKVNLIELDIVRRSGILSERELDITTNYSVAKLLELLATGELTSVETTVAFSKRAAIAGQLTNCLTETMFEEAEKRARYLDFLREKGETAGPLHGLPISLKDTFQIVGTQATIGLTAYLDRVSKENSSLVDLLLDLGAVLYVKTNVPQTMMTADSENIIFGRTLNPHNTLLTAGGSSGGEGSLVAFRGSPLGVGTDIAGSIRIPSLCCGTYGFRPSTARIPYGKQQGCSNPGFKTILPVAGPLANDLESLKIFTKAVIQAQPAEYDSTALAIPWRDNVEDSVGPKLRLGLLVEDPMFPVHPPVRAALEQASLLLKAQGHEIVPLGADECQISYIHDVTFAYFGMDNTSSGIVAQGGEPPIASRLAAVNELKAIAAGGGGLPDLAQLSPFEKLAALNIRRAAISEMWHKIWATHQLDAVICPGAQSTALEHDTFGLVPYTSFLNLLDYPACIIPLGRAQAYPPFEKKSAQSMPKYNSTAVENAPCAIQVFTKRLRDEECLAVSKIIDNCLLRG